MTKSIKERNRKKLVRNIISGKSQFSEKAIKVKFSYQKHISNKSYLSEIHYAIRDFKRDFQKTIQPVIKKNISRLISEISKNLNIYDFELSIRIHYAYRTKNPKTYKSFTVNFYLLHNNKNIGSFIFSELTEKEIYNSQYTYKSFFSNVDSSELIAYSRKIETSNVYVSLVSDGLITEEKSDNTIIIKQSKLVNINQEIKSKIEKFYRDDCLIPLICKDIYSINIHYFLGSKPKFSLIFYKRFDLENLSVGPNQSHSFLHDCHNITDVLMLEILTEAEILPSDLVYEENKMTKEYLYDIFKQAQILNY